MRRIPPSNHTSEDAARDLATRALVFVAAQQDLVEALLTTSGAQGAALRDMVGQPEFPGFMLDFILAEDERVCAFSAAEGITPQDVAAIRARLDADSASGGA